MDLQTAYDAYRAVATEYAGTTFAGDRAKAAALDDLLAAVAETLSTPSQAAPTFQSVASQLP